MGVAQRSNGPKRPSDPVAKSMDRDRRQAFGKRWTPSARAPEMAEHQRSPSTAVMHHRRATCGGGPERRSASMPVQRKVSELPSERGSDHSRAPERQGEEPAEHRSNRGSEAPSAKVTKRVEPEIRIHENKRKGRAPGKPSAAAAEGQTTQAMERPRSGEELGWR